MLTMTELRRASAHMRLPCDLDALEPEWRLSAAATGPRWCCSHCPDTTTNSSFTKSPDDSISICGMNSSIRATPSRASKKRCRASLHTQSQLGASLRMMLGHGRCLCRPICSAKRLRQYGQVMQALGHHQMIPLAQCSSAGTCVPLLGPEAVTYLWLPGLACLETFCTGKQVSGVRCWHAHACC